MTRAFLLLTAIGLMPISTSASAGGREHLPLARDVASGRLVPLSTVIEQVRARMRGYRHIGSEYDPRTLRYRLKFMGDGQVVWIDVDARSGQVLGTMSR